MTLLRHEYALLYVPAIPFLQNVVCQLKMGKTAAMCHLRNVLKFLQNRNQTAGQKPSCHIKTALFCDKTAFSALKSCHQVSR